MNFIETPLAGAFVIEAVPIVDERGFFARTWCAREFAERGLNPCLVQCNISHSRLRGTLRGMHYQAGEHAEVKLVRCTSGSIFDVITDLRTGSPTYCQWFGTILSGQNHRLMYVPEGFAHGFQTLDDSTEVFYQMSEFYRPDAVRGMRWNDPSVNIEWPQADERIMSERDRSYPDYHLQ